jgi:hypothetical protein
MILRVKIQVNCMAIYAGDRFLFLQYSETPSGRLLLLVTENSNLFEPVLAAISEVSETVVMLRRPGEAALLEGLTGMTFHDSRPSKKRLPVSFL